MKNQEEKNKKELTVMRSLEDYLMSIQIQMIIQKNICFQYIEKTISDFDNDWNSVVNTSLK